MTPEEAIAEVRSIPQKLAGVDLTRPLGECREVVRESIRENFANQSGPDGSPWPPRKPRKDDDGHPLLDDTGFLKAAALGLGPGGFDDLSSKEMSIGIDKSVDLGGIPGAQAHDRGNPSTNLPQREFFNPDGESLDECGEILATFIEQAVF